MLIRKPSQLAPKSTISIMVYGAAGMGKSTLACSAPNPILLDADGGVQRINGAHQVDTVQITRWEDVVGDPRSADPDEKLGALGVIARDEAQGLCHYDTVIIDTVGKALDFMSDYIIRNNPKMGQRDGSLSLKGYGERKIMFINLIKRLSMMGKNVVFVAHEREEKQGENTYKRPEIRGSSAGDLIKELDLVGYMTAYGNERIISFDPNEFYIAKNACNLAPNMKVPVVVDRATGNAIGSNNFLSQVIASYETWQIQQRQQTAAYEALVNDIATAVSGADSADDLNALMASIAKREAIWNSKIVAFQKMNLRASQIGAKYDSIAKKYVAA